MEIVILIGITILLLGLTRIVLRFKARWQSTLDELETQKAKTFHFKEEFAQMTKNRDELLTEWERSTAILQRQLDYFSKSSNDYNTLTIPVIRIQGQVLANPFEKNPGMTVERARLAVTRQIAQEVTNYLTKHDLIEYVTVADNPDHYRLKIGGQIYVNFLPPGEGFKIPSLNYTTN